MTTLHLSSPEEEDEARMRRALGTLEGNRGRQDGHHGPRPARQFAQDGDVPVVRLSGRKDPGVAASAKLEEALQTERAAREMAETALRQANATIQALQTKIAHAEIAHAEALAAERRNAEQAIAAAAAVPAPVQAKPAKPPQAQADEEDQEPVQWWVPGWRKGLKR